jgi:glycosyltransferase involved in cell wall biosynthesis
MNKIKVCHIITMLELGGAQRNTLFTVGNLDRDKFVPVLISGRGGLLDREAKGISGLKTYFIDELTRPVSPMKDLISIFKIYKVLRVEKPDIVHTHSSKAGITGRIAAFLARIPVVIHTYHGFGFNDFQNMFSKMIYILAEKFANPLTTRFIAVTNEDITKGIKYGLGGSRKYSLIRSGIDTSKYFTPKHDKGLIKKELGIPSLENIVTTIGPFKPQKNLRDFIKACAVTLQSFPETCFIIVGDGEERQLIEELIAQLKLSEKVKLLGWRQDIDRILAVSDIFVLSSLWEGLPRSVLEAMCSGVPVVANAVDGVKEIISEGVTGFLIEPRNIKMLSDKIVYLLKNPGVAKDMGNKARESISRQYDINYMLKQQEELYTELMEKK